MTSKKAIIISILFFLLVNTSYFIENLSGLWDFLVAILILLGFPVLSVILIGQLYKLFKEKASNKSRIVSSFILLVTLILTGLFPTGLVNYENLLGEDLLIASREGAANCQMVMKIKKNGTFIHTSLCFGVDRWTGRHEIKGDTIKFKYTDTAKLANKFAYGLIKFKESNEQVKSGRLLLFNEQNDTIGYPMTLTYIDINKPHNQ